MLRKAYEAYLLAEQVSALLAVVSALDVSASEAGTEEYGNEAQERATKARTTMLKREDLKLTYFDYIWH